MEMLSQIPNRQVTVINPAKFEEIGSVLELSTVPSLDTIWFPRKIADLDNEKKIRMYVAELNANNPVFNDPVYRKRREQFAEIAKNYKYGTPIPKIEYTAQEIKTWGIIFKELYQLFPKYACDEYLENLPKLVKYCGFREDNIPQLQDVSDFLKKTTGFQLRPVAGYLSPRDFLAGLAFRVFHCTQYVRHSAEPFYTPEPDICHELLGHVPLLLNPSFAQFMQEIGLASLGAADDDIDKLATLFCYTAEFGLCKQDGDLRVYGAGLLSSSAELKHVVTVPEKTFPFDPEIIVKQECIDVDFQSVYYYTDTLEEAKEKIRNFANQIKRPFKVRYNPNSQSVEVLTDTQNMTGLVSELRDKLFIVSNDLSKIEGQNKSANAQKIPSFFAPSIDLQFENTSSSSGSDSDVASLVSLYNKPI